MDLKNLTMDDLKEKVSGIDKKTWIKFGIGLGAIILFLIIYYAVLKPMVDQRKAKYQDKLKKIEQIENYKNDILTIKSKIKKITPEFQQTSTLFHSKAEVEDIYQSLSVYADANGLVISKIVKKKPKAILKPGIAKQADKNIQKDMVSYYKIPVDYEIRGNFLRFIKFKRDVSRSKKSLNFDKESISVVKNDSTGAIVVKGRLTIVGLPDEFF